MRNRTLLLTGATGIMGSWVLGEALARGYDPVVLMRDESYDSALGRLQTVLEHVGRSGDLNRVRIVLGEAGQPNLGMSADTARELRESVGFVLHCAACTSFRPDQTDQIWSTNVYGVVNLLNFLKDTDIPLFHVSTAYVAGKRTGRVYETELDVEQAFNNTYEQSKCESEKMVRKALDTGQLRGAIFRPSIITGATDDGRILTFMNFYNVLRMIDMLSKRRSTEQQIFRVTASLEGTKNLIPVDWAIQALWHIIEAEGPSGQVYHLTNPNPMTHLQLQTWANSLLADCNIAVNLVPELHGAVSSLESMVAAGFSNYRPYMFSEPDFDRTNTDRALGGALPFPEVSPEYFVRLLETARAQRWRSVFDTRSAASRDLAQREQRAETPAPEGAATRFEG